MKRYILLFVSAVLFFSCNLLPTREAYNTDGQDPEELVETSLIVVRIASENEKAINIEEKKVVKADITLTAPDNSKETKTWTNGVDNTLSFINKGYGNYSITVVETDEVNTTVETSKSFEVKTLKNYFITIFLGGSISVDVTFSQDIFSNQKFAEKYIIGDETIPVEWQYGWKSSITGVFNEFENRRMHNGNSLLYNIELGIDPNVRINTLETINYGVQPGKFACHPGTNGIVVVCRWKATKNGIINIESFVGEGDRSSNVYGKVDFYIQKNGSPLFSEKDIAEDTTFTLNSVTVSEGDIIDFIIGAGSDTYACDSTPFDATISY